MPGSWRPALDSAGRYKDELKELGRRSGSSNHSSFACYGYNNMMEPSKVVLDTDVLAFRLRSRWGTSLRCLPVLGIVTQRAFLTRIGEIG